MVELADAADLKSAGFQPCRFESGYQHHVISSCSVMNAWYSESSCVSVAIFSKECASSCSLAVSQIRFEALLFSLFPQMYVSMKKWHLQLIANVANIDGVKGTYFMCGKILVSHLRGHCFYGWWCLLASISTRRNELSVQVEMIYTCSVLKPIRRWYGVILLPIR